MVSEQPPWHHVSLSLPTPSPRPSDALGFRWMSPWSSARWQIAVGHTIAVTHPAVIRSTLVHTLQSPPSSFWRIDIAPLSLTDLRWNCRVWTVRSSGCALLGDAGQP
jgi:broad specificity phosphatase PhoE